VLNGITGVTSAILVATDAARYLARWAMMLAGLTVVLALALVSPFGLDGAAIATAVPYVVFFPYMLRITLRAVPVPLGELVRRSFAPAWVLGGVLAVALIAVRLTVDPQSAPAVAATALAGLVAFWIAYYALWLDSGERSLVRAVAGGFARRRTSGRRRTAWRPGRAAVRRRRARTALRRGGRRRSTARHRALPAPRGSR
jgi:hypothetical protein